MATLDSNLPKRSLGPTGDLLLFLRSILDLPEYEGQTFAWQAWSHGFSFWSMMASQARELEEIVDEHLGLNEQHWSEQRKRVDELREQLKESPNQLMRSWAQAVGAGNVRLGAIMHLRLTRMAIELRLRTDPEPLPDPFGDRLSYEVEGAVASSARRADRAYWTHPRRNNPPRVYPFPDSIRP
ncbi:MAG: hypothetical protein ACYTG5_23310, partial [Planctomycetota bacterium]|jgi:hypothetical protein